ncbi:MAG: hypothetical protein AAGL89_11265 [Pseudomonadota bacterium]
MIGKQAILFPLHGTFVATHQGQEHDLMVLPRLGAGVVAALKQSKPLRGKALTLGEQMRAFEDRMDVFRQDIGVGKARFLRDLSNVSVTQTPDGLKIAGLRPARGRYAFEGGGPERVLAGPDAAQPMLIGQAVVSVLGRETQTPAK